ncbi:MAG: efflux RND transporter periplasmic adaptor subunit [Thermacetogeniaceae bacterium]
MKRFRTALLILGALIIVGGLFGLAYYVYESLNFFSTQNAQVTADMITMTPEVTGKLNSWDVKEGDVVKTGQTIGVQDVSTLVTSTALSPQALSSSADSIIAKADIKSPIDGKVVESDVIAGQVISPGMQIAIIADTSHIYIKANIEETSILRIRPGQVVDIGIDAYPHRVFKGYIESIGQATQTAFSSLPSLNTSGTYSKVTQLIPVKIDIMNADNLSLMPGMNATVKIHIK